MASDPFERLEAMLSMVPLSRLQCPKCNAHGDEDFRLVYRITFTSFLEWDGPSKILTADYQSEELVQVVEFSIDCMCGHNFPVPDGWQVANPRAEKKKVSRQKSELRQKMEAAEAEEAALKKAAANQWQNNTKG